MNTEHHIATLFEKLSAWRQLPAYQLERRADIFFALYLEHILRPTYPQLTFDLIVPEFPLRLGTLYDVPETLHRNLSVKVDYACFDTQRNVCVLLELKTDEASICDQQCKHMEKAREGSLSKLLAGILDLQKASKSKRKYQALVDLLISKGLFSGVVPTPIPLPLYTIRLAIILPRESANVHPKESFETITFAQIQKRLEPLLESDALARHFSRALGDWQ